MWQITGILGIALALTGGAFKLHVDKSKAEKESLQTSLNQAVLNQEILEGQIASLNETIQKQEQAYDDVFQRLDVMREENQKAQAEVEDMRKKFAKHDLTVLSLRKPALIEKIINKGTAEVLNDFETITASSADI